ncbi:cytokinin oxidase 7 [Actinidia rufa]|uniref:Cytokinin oxidase 7 n=1 Tax=Actinidia rufa TaxID=165716 RepID=A0A7J0GXM4_9ERIC|nr:cytokinin oxidase 7 [Actinidia rufa]
MMIACLERFVHETDAESKPHDDDSLCRGLELQGSIDLRVHRRLSRASSRSSNLTVAARGNGHSINGQAMADAGLVIDMRSMTSSMDDAFIQVVRMNGAVYADVGGGALWEDVLKRCVFWAFRYGPQTENVSELEVVTGKGEIVVCTATHNSELFFGVLGGLGQFGIITRARVLLQSAPDRVRWIRGVYAEFDEFARDAELLVVERLLGRLRFCKDLRFQVDLSYVEFLLRVKRAEEEAKLNGIWDAPHPWLNLFVSGRNIADFDHTVFKNILKHGVGGPMLVYPMLRSKWDDRNSIVLPEGEIFYMWHYSVLVCRIRKARGWRNWLLKTKKSFNVVQRMGLISSQVVPSLTTQNRSGRSILGINGQDLWRGRLVFDPMAILAPGQKIFSRNRQIPS